MNIVFQVLWVAAGLVGYAIVRRDPDRFTFDSPLWTILALVAMAALFPVWGGPLFLVLVLALPAKRLCPRCRRTLPKAAATCAHTVVLGPVAWALPSMFLGIATANYLSEPMMLLLLRERYQQYADYQRRKFPADVQHWANVLFGIVLLLIVPIVLVMQDFYAAALPDALVVHQPLAATGERYAYDDVTTIRRTARLVETDGDIKRLDQPAYVVEFADGRRWWARGDLGNYDPPALATWIEYVSRQSGVPIRDVDALDSADLK